MSKAYQCDRCGCYFSGEKRVYFSGVKVDADFCPECVRSFEKWIKMEDGVESEDTSDLCKECNNERCVMQSGICRNNCDFFIAKESEAKDSRKFEEIVVEYPPAESCIYPEYIGKPYFSIKYEESGSHIIGFGTYKPEVLSRYLREYFIRPTVPEPYKAKKVVLLRVNPEPKDE